jgi:hypothetical protein
MTLPIQYMFYRASFVLGYLFVAETGILNKFTTFFMCYVSIMILEI